MHASTVLYSNPLIAMCLIASEISGSGSSGAATGGAVGGILFIIITIIIAVLVIFYIRQLKRKKAQLCESKTYTCYS